MREACTSSPTRLTAAEWRARERAHFLRVSQWTGPHRERAARGEKHPVWDFLFEYYAYRPAWLERWHPGPDFLLEDGPAPEPLPESRRPFVHWLLALLENIANRPGFFACHGLHEWAMVYREAANGVRHAQVPLRFPPAQLAAIVESLPIRCTHFDAFRFFTPEARPLNRLQPTRSDAPALEQRGCLHANMDLYKWSFKLAPFAPGELIADCFELARDIRAVDMRASPYDLAAWGFGAIPIETAAGREAYETHQRAFAARSEPLRARLIALCRRLLQAAPHADGSPRGQSAAGDPQEAQLSHH